MKTHTCLPGKPSKHCPACREELRYQRAINASKQTHGDGAPQPASPKPARTA